MGMLEIIVITMLDEFQFQTLNFSHGQERVKLLLLKNRFQKFRQVVVRYTHSDSIIWSFQTLPEFQIKKTQIYLRCCGSRRSRKEQAQYSRQLRSPTLPLSTPTVWSGLHILLTHATSTAHYVGTVEKKSIHQYSTPHSYFRLPTYWVSNSPSPSSGSR